MIIFLLTLSVKMNYDTNSVKNSLISILVNCYNSEKFISECIHSLLNQTYKNIEIIV